MSEFKLTPAQQEAVDTRGCPVLVSAAAGSGKTRVLTERLMARVMEGEDVDRFLVITFTRAAAAELRGRILTELNAAIAANPGDRRLRRQSALLYRAQIGTIDSFCTTVVRENAHRLGISPGFSILDEERSQSLLAGALEDVLDRAYETMARDEGLALLVDSVGAGRDDRRLAEHVRSVYAQMQSHAFPEAWAEEMLRPLDEDITDAAQTPWGAYLLEDAAAEAEYRAAELEQALEVMARPENALLQKGYGEAFSELALQFRDTARACRESWDKAVAILDQPDPRLGSVRKFDDEETKLRVKTPWNGAKKAKANLRAALAGDSDSLLASIRRAEPALRALMGLVFRLDREYAARKRRADVCDFSDVEHFCVRLLCDEKTGGPTALAGELSRRFCEVMVDEYQDVNAVQELIFRRVSREGRTLFMVGDVKQSIYRFRLADPSIFNEKYNAFADRPDARRILLQENFRSRGSVLSACNSVFEKIMSPALGEIEYNEHARLVRGASYPAAGEVKAELCILDPGLGEDDGEETPDKTLQEARYVAGRIRRLVDGGTLVSDGRGGMRPVRWGDIALLLRTPGTTGKVYQQALAEAGVPVSARQGGAFFSQPEVSFVTSMLAAVDNPRQDIPLIAALRGLPFAFTPDELSAVRAAARGDFWDALCLRSGEDEKCRRFVELLQELRDLAPEESTQGLLRRLYDRTELLAACSVMTDAPQRIANLMQLYEYARKFEQDGNRGLFRFVGWLRELNRRGMEPPTAAAGDTVTILSIHKSKGLEFPVVFLCDCSHRWSRTGGLVLCHRTLGLGMKLTDAEKGVSWSTLPYRAIEKRAKMEELSEQERVLYVAMTRAKERLIMTCTVTKAEEKLAAMAQESAGAVHPRLLAGASSAAPWLMRAAAMDGGRTISCSVVQPDTLRETAADALRAPLAADAADREELTRRLAWVYPHAGTVALPSKLTATAVSAGAADPETAELVPSERTGARRFRSPRLGGEEKPLTGAERGIAAHLVMQHIDFDRTGDENAVAGELERLQRQGFLTEQQAAAVSPGDILAFFRSELGERLRRARRVIREFRFSLLSPADQWFPEAPAGEDILLQGVVDCCLVEEDGLLVVDFKTDAQVCPERYTGQLNAYAGAMGRIYDTPVKGAALWYLRKKQLCWVDLPENSRK